MHKLDSGRFTPRDSWYLINIQYLLWTLRHSNVTLSWCPGHIGIPGNERADQAAKSAPTIGRIMNIHIPVTDLRGDWHADILATWQMEWTQHGVHSRLHLFRIQPHIRHRPWFLKMGLPRAATAMYSTLRLGVYPTPHKLNQIGRRDTPMCPCGDYGDINHIILGCSNIHHRLRDTLQWDLLKYGLSLPYNVPYIIQHTHRHIVLALVHYLHRCKMKDTDRAEIL